MKKHASRCLLVIRLANFDVQHSMPDSPRPKYAKSSLFALSEIQKHPEKNGEIHFITVLSLFARQWHVFHHQISCFPGAAPVIICHGDFQESFRKRASHNRSSLPKRDATREKFELSFPEGILLTTHDHALLTKNFRALAPGEINKSSFKSARSAHTTELAACNAHATLRRPARPPGFLMLPFVEISGTYRHVVQ